MDSNLLVRFSTGSTFGELESIRHSSYLWRAVAALSRGDAERLLCFVAEAESIGIDEPFTGELLVELGRLIEADWVTYTEVDHVHRRSLAYVQRHGDEEDDGAEITDEGWERMPEHPICKRWRRDGRFSALRLTDVMRAQELRENRFLDEFFRPWGIIHELKVRLPSPPWHALTFMFNRRKGRNFTQRDRLVLELLSPHLSRIWQSARTRRVLAAALDALELAPETEPHGIVLLGAGDQVEFASPPARRLLRKFFPPASGGMLPAPVGTWLTTGATETLVRETDSGRLIVRRTEAGLLLEERLSGVALTSREQDVLFWVARGKTNAQIAELLWLAPSTVRKHLENVYPKLGVNTRTAAVARFLGLLDAEAS
jgi:DNA-binding CsgD family transcriptional regulator